MVILPPPEWFTESDAKAYLDLIPKNRRSLRQNRKNDSKHVYCVDGYARTFREYKDRRDAEMPAFLEGYVECRDATKAIVRVAGIARPFGTVWFFRAIDTEARQLIKLTETSYARVERFRALCAYINDKDGYMAHLANLSAPDPLVEWLSSRQYIDVRYSLSVTGDA